MIRCSLSIPGLAVVVVVAMALAQPAQAGTLYATDVYGSVAHLYQVNTTNGTLTDRGVLHTATGTTPIAWGTSLAFDSHGTLWGLDGISGWVGTINPSNALVTPVPAQASTINCPGFISGIAFDPISHVLYASCEHPGTGARRGLYTIDQSTGVYTLVAAYDSVILAGIAFGNDGYLYGVNYTAALYRIDVNNGYSLTAIGTTGALTGVRDLTSISDAASVSFFVEADSLSTGRGGLGQLLIGSPNTSSAVGPLTNALSPIDGLAYWGPPAVPEPSSFALTAGLGALALAFGWRWRNQSGR